LKNIRSGTASPTETFAAFQRDVRFSIRKSLLNAARRWRACCPQENMPRAAQVAECRGAWATKFGFHRHGFVQLKQTILTNAPDMVTLACLKATAQA